MRADAKIKAGMTSSQTVALLSGVEFEISGRAESD